MNLNSEMLEKKLMNLTERHALVHVQSAVLCTIAAHNIVRARKFSRVRYTQRAAQYVFPLKKFPKKFLNIANSFLNIMKNSLNIHSMFIISS